MKINGQDKSIVNISLLSNKIEIDGPFSSKIQQMVLGMVSNASNKQYDTNEKKQTFFHLQLCFYAHWRFFLSKVPYQ